MEIIDLNIAIDCEVNNLPEEKNCVCLILVKWKCSSSSGSTPWILLVLKITVTLSDTSYHHLWWWQGRLDRWVFHCIVRLGRFVPVPWVHSFERKRQQRSDPDRTFPSSCPSWPKRMADQRSIDRMVWWCDGTGSSWSTLTAFLSETKQYRYTCVLGGMWGRQQTCWRFAHGWYKATIAPCSRLCSHRWGGTYWYSPYCGQSIRCDPLSTKSISRKGIQGGSCWRLDVWVWMFARVKLDEEWLSLSSRIPIPVRFVRIECISNQIKFKAITQRKNYNWNCTYNVGMR